MKFFQDSGINSLLSLKMNCPSHAPIMYLIWTGSGPWWDPTPGDPGKLSQSPLRPCHAHNFFGTVTAPGTRILNEGGTIIEGIKEFIGLLGWLYILGMMSK